MPASHKNRVKMTVSGTPGTGTITLGSASSGFQSLATAYGANATVDVVITDGTAWEVARNCTYTHSGTTLTRGTLEESSTGSAISLTSAAVVMVTATATRGQTWDAAALEHVAGTDANTTMAVNSLYVVDMSAWATADRTYTLPATAAVGDRVGIMVTAGDASHELLITAASGDTLNAVAGGTEWSRLFITGEVVIMRCVTANSAWVVEHDGRIPCSFYARCTTASNSNETAATLTVPTTLTSFVWTADSNVGSCFATGTSRTTLRRAGVWCFAGVYQSKSSVSDGNYASMQLTDGSFAIAFVEAAMGAARIAYVSGAGLGYSGAVGAYCEYQFRTQEGSKQISTGARFNGTEIL